MKNLSKLICTLFAAIIILTLATTTKVEATQQNIIKISTPASLYNMINGKQVNVGSLTAGETFVTYTEDAKFYYVPFGNSTAYFNKSQAQTVSNGKPVTTAQNSNLVVVTKQMTPIYESSSNTSKVLGKISTNMRYPVVAASGQWYKVKIGNRLGYITKGSVSVDNGVPVLMYHHIVENPARAGQANNNMVIKVSAFREQMAYLKKNGYRTITLDQLENYLLHRQNLTGKVVAITFDDGLLSSIKYAYPTMKQYGFKATSFIIGGRIRQESQPWNEKSLQYVGLKEMKASMDVFDHQHHTMSMHLRDKNQRTRSLYQVRTAFEIKEDTLKGTKQISRIYDNGDTSHVKYLAYPFGMYNKNAIKGISSAGIKLAFTTVTGNVKLGDSHYELKRQGVSPKTSMKDFTNKLNGTFR